MSQDIIDLINKVISETLEGCQIHTITYKQESGDYKAVISLTGHTPYDKTIISYEQMSKLATALGTKKINMVHEAGWGGSDITAGDPDLTNLEVLDINPEFIKERWG